MKETTAVRIETLVSEITHYLSRHPHGADSLEGVATWWLKDRGKVLNADDLRQALDRLVASGTVRAVRNVDGQVIYSSAVHRVETNE